MDIRCPNAGSPLPETLDHHDGVIVFGGPMSANDDATEPGIRAELDWLPKVIKSDTPYLGICLGAQMLSRVLGGSVAPHPEGLVEIGYYDVVPTEAGRDFLPHAQKMYQWHREGMTLPDGAELLATGEAFREQAYRYGTCAYAVQFHPEVTRQMIKQWTVSAAHRLVLPNARRRETHLADNTMHDPAVDIWIEQFMVHWLSLCPGHEDNQVPTGLAAE